MWLSVKSFVFLYVNLFVYDVRSIFKEAVYVGVSYQVAMS